MPPPASPLPKSVPVHNDDAIDSGDVIRFRASMRNPFTVEYLPLLSRLHRFAFRKRSRGLAKRLISKPAKFAFEWMMKVGVGGVGRARIQTPSGERSIPFNARNTQFSALYMPDYAPVYETETSSVLDRLVGDMDVFYDIGANWGWYSALIASRPSFAGEVHAFEPFPSSFGDLKKLVQEAGFENRIHCHPLALSDRSGESTMAMADNMHSGLAKLGGSRGAHVRLMKLDNLDLPPPDVIKIDVEGHEIEVLRGAAKVIVDARPFIVFESGLEPARPDATLAPIRHLIDLGYQLFYTGWVAPGDPECILFSYGHFTPDGSQSIALVPFLPAHRFQLGPLMNIIAAPAERMDEFRHCFESRT